LAFIQLCAGAGRRGGQIRRSEDEKPREFSPLFDGFSKCCAHSRENLKLKARWVDVAGGVSESVDEVLACSGGRARASAVSRRASSRVLVGLIVRGGEVVGDSEEKVEGRILPMKVQRFLLGVLDGEGVSGVNFGLLMSVVVSSLRDELRLYVVGGMVTGIVWAGVTIPSKPRKRFEVGI
jgi:hypothetical protein